MLKQQGVFFLLCLKCFVLNGYNVDRFDCLSLQTVTDKTINAMVDRNRPLVKSYAQSQEKQKEEQDDEETMETDSGSEDSPEPVNTLS